MSKFFKVTLAALAFTLSGAAMAQGKIAVVDLQQAILQTDLAQKRIDEVRNGADYKADKAEFDRLKDEFDDLVRKLQKDMAVMSKEQQQAARQKLASKQADLEHVGRKVQGRQQQVMQEIMIEKQAQAQEVPALPPPPLPPAPPLPPPSPLCSPAGA